MATQVQFRRGTTAETAAFIGADSEVTVDTTKKTCVVHDGSQLGGYPLLREDGSNSALLPGSLSSCSLKFVNDPNTGIISPSSDQISLVTGGVSRLLVDSSGSVSIPGNIIVGGSFSGAISFNDGTASSPSIKFLNSPDTGFYSPGTKQVAISTNGSGRLFVNSSGNTGFGTSSPNATGFAGTVATINIATGSNGGLELTKNNVAAGHFTVESNANNDIRVGAVGASAALTFQTAGSERLRITSAGLVGIGTSSPLKELQINATTPTIRLEENSASAKRLELSVNSSAEASIFATQSASQLLFGTVGTERMRIDASGRVGIGTSSPGYALDTLAGSGSAIAARFRGNGGANNNTQIRFYGNNAATDQWAIGGSIATSDTGRDFHIYDLVANANRFAINSSGNVGIGTTSPNYSLDIAGSPQGNINLTSTTGTNSALLRVNNTGGTGYIGLDSSAGGLGGAYSFNIWHSGSYPIVFATSNTERARIDSSGRLLVGTSSSSAEAKFIVEGGATGSGGGMNIQRSVTTASAGNTIGFINFTNSANNVGATVIAEGDGTWSAGTSHPTRLVFSTTADGASSPTERMRITSSGYSKFSTNGTYNGTDAHTFYQSNTNQYALLVGGFGNYTATVLAVQGTNATATAFNLFEGYYGGNQTTGLGAAIAFRIRGDGNVTNLNNSYGAISDIKLKENIVDAASQWNDIKALQVRKYNFKEGQTHTQIGLIAQEVELVSPGLVTESPDRDAEGNDLGTVTKNVNYSVLYMKAVKALQEAMERIETLEAKVAALESA